VILVFRTDGGILTYVVSSSKCRESARFPNAGLEQMPRREVGIADRKGEMLTSRLG
jgi:hypothetical protein